MKPQQLDLFGFINPVVPATKAPVVVETVSAPNAPIINLWAKTMAIPVMVLAAIASGEAGRRPAFLPTGALIGAAALAADAYGIGMCRSLNMDDQEDSASSTPIAAAMGIADFSDFSVVEGGA